MLLLHVLLTLDISLPKDVFKCATSDTIVKILTFRSYTFQNETDGFRVRLDTCILFTRACGAGFGSLWNLDYILLYVFACMLMFYVSVCMYISVHVCEFVSLCVCVCVCVCVCICKCVCACVYMCMYVCTCS